MTNKNKILKDKSAPPISIVKPSMHKKNIFKYAKRYFKKPTMHHVFFNAKYTCHACNQVGHLKYDCPFKRKTLSSIKYIWVPKGTIANNYGPKLVWVPKFSS